MLGGGQAGPHKVEGIGSSFIPKTFDASVCDEVMVANDVEAFEHGERTGGARGRAGWLERRSQCIRLAADRSSSGTGKARDHHDSGFRRALSVEEDF